MEKESNGPAQHTPTTCKDRIMTALTKQGSYARTLSDSDRARARISAERFIRREYARPGLERRSSEYALDWHPLPTALVLDMQEIARVGGEELQVEAVYAEEGYHTLIGGAQQPDGSWEWSVWAD